MASNVEAASSSDVSKIISEDKKTMEGRTITLIIVFVVAGNLVAIVGLILGIVEVAKTGNNVYNIGSTDQTSAGESGGDDKILMFQIGHFIGNTQYLDETSGTIKGYNVDVVNAVCQIANKNCRLTWDLYERCWDSQAGERPRGGIGLMGRWYDACVGWAITRDRARTYLFTNSFEKAFEPTFFVKTDGSFTSPAFSGLKVGFLDGWSVDEHCLARYEDVTGFDQNDVNKVIHYGSEDDVINALMQDQIDVAFLPRVPYLDTHLDVDQAAYQPTNDLCVFGGPAMMTPKDQRDLVSLWNDAFDQLRVTSQYQDICQNVKDEHGDQPGNDPEYICVD